MTHRRYFFVSLFLVLMTTGLITFSDYWITVNAATAQWEDYALKTARHLSHQLFQPTGPGVNIEDPDSFSDHRDTIQNLAASFGLLNVKIYNRDGVIVFDLFGTHAGQQIRGNDNLRTALGGRGSSHVAEPDFRDTTYRGREPFPMLETYVPIFDPGTGNIVGAYEIFQDYQPLKDQLFTEIFRSGAFHLILLLVFAGLFYRYGQFTSRLMGTTQRALIRELEDRVEERTLELKRSRDRVNELLKRKEEIYRNLMIADEYKKNFMGLISHELRTPLTVIKGYLSMMRDGDLGPVYVDLKDVVDTCVRESGKLESIINNILELSQLERGVFDLSGELIDIQGLVAEGVENVMDEFPERKSDIVIKVEKEVSPFPSDRIKLLQVLHQFLSNALKFSPTGSTILVQARPSHRGLLLSVSDEGLGIPKGQVNDIFSLFYQVDVSTTRSYEGSGLGLAIVQSIAQILGGRVWVESEEKVGSTFFFEVGAMDQSELATAPSEPSGETAPSSLKRSFSADSRSILVLDDDQDFLYLMRRILIDGGYTVEMCKDGLDGLNRIFGPNHSPPALIVLDIRMPNINGIDFLSIIRRNMTTREIPVVIVSALGQDTQVQEGLNAGANAYFVKPFDPETLLARIDFLLGKETSAEG